MCAILDNNVVHEVFGPNRPPAGKGFFEWINSGNGSLIVGGKLLAELDGQHEFKKWRQQARLAGRVRRISDQSVKDKTQSLEETDSCQSNDEHVIALAQISGARLLYSNDEKLHKDFVNVRLIDKPRGKVYSTLKNKKFHRTHHRKLLEMNQCRT